MRRGAVAAGVGFVGLGKDGLEGGSWVLGDGGRGGGGIGDEGGEGAHLVEA